MDTPTMEMIGSESDEFDFIEYFRLIWHRKWLVTITVLLVTTLAVLVPFLFVPPKYESSSQLLQRRLSLDEAFLGSEVFSEKTSEPERYIETSVELVKSPEVVAAVIDRMGDKLDGIDDDQLVELIKVETPDKADIIQITATHTDPDIAAEIANTFADEYINWKQDKDQEVLEQARAPIEQNINNTPADQRNTTSYAVILDKLETLKLTEALQVGNTQVINKAQPSNDQISPRPVRNGVVAFITSFFLGIGLVFLLNRMDKKIRDVGYITSRIDKPILAFIPREPKLKGGLVTISHPMGSNAEAYRLLKTNLQYINPDQKTKTILVTSPGPYEGKSTTIANLAVTFARGGNKVTALELDFRRPSLAKHLGLHGSVGITNFISGTHSFEDILQVIPAKDLVVAGDDAPKKDRQKQADADGVQDVICAVSGPIPPNPGELVASDKISSIIDSAAEASDYVLIDTPPLGVVGDAASLTAKVDGIIVIVRIGQSEKNTLHTLQNILMNLPSNLLGIVITDADVYPSGYSGSYYSYE